MIYARHQTVMPSGEFSLAIGKIPVNVVDLAPKTKAWLAPETKIQEYAEIRDLKLQWPVSNHYKLIENQQDEFLFLDFIGKNTWAFKELIQTSG
jgi:hypothetical protein